MKTSYLVVFVLVWTTACMQTVEDSKPYTLIPGDPAAAGMSSERLARIDDMCESAIEAGQVPGMVALVARKGRIVYHKAFGMADNQAGRPMEKNTIFRIASQSKAITATAVMMLWEEGLFRLDDPIAKYIPAFENAGVLVDFDYSDTTYTTVPAGRPITIRHLLTHTSGVGYGMIDRDDRFRMIYQKAGVTDLFTTAPVTIGESVSRLGVLPLHHDPGEGYTYSEGLDVLGRFIEVVSGMPFDQFLRERLFDPLGMDDTWFYLPEDKADRLVTIQTRQNGEWVPYPVTFYDPAYPVKGARSFFSGGAGLCSTAKDYARFLQMYLNGGELNGVRILSRTTIATIMGNHFPDVRETRDEYYGLVFGVLTEQGSLIGGLGSPGTFDWGGYFNTQYFADPGEQLLGLIMKQTRDISGDQTGWKFRQLVFQAIDD